MTQKVSRVFSLSFSISLDVFSISCYCSIMMNLACRLKLCPVWLKCFSTGMVLGSLTSFLWLFNRILKAVSAFPTSWILQSFHSSKYMMKLLLQVVFWNILNVLLVWSLLKCSAFINFVQQSVLEFEKHGEHFSLVNLLVVTSFLFFSIVFPPFNCLRDLFLRKANRGLVFKYHFKFRVDVQYVPTFLDYCFYIGFCYKLRIGWGGFPVYIFSLFKSLVLSCWLVAFWISTLTIVSGQPFFNSCFFKLSVCFLYSPVVEQIRFRRNAWL